MKIRIECTLAANEEECLQLALSLIKNRPPKVGSFDYGLETHGVLDWNTPYPIQVHQTNKRLSEKSTICIRIENTLSYRRIKLSDILTFTTPENRWLSNMTYVDIQHQGITYPSTENFYQAIKYDKDDFCKDVDDLITIRKYLAKIKALI